MFAELSVGKPVTFAFIAKDAGSIQILGSFNRERARNFELSLVDNRCVKLQIDFANKAYYSLIFANVHKKN